MRGGAGGRSSPFMPSIPTGFADMKEQGRISRCGDELARAAFYEAAHTLLTRCKKWSTPKAWGCASLSAAGWRGRVAAARKPAVILLS